MLSAAMHPDVRRDRPFAAAQGDMDDGNGVTLAGSNVRDHAVMLSTAMHPDVRRDRPFAAAQGDIERHLRLMRIGADKSALGAINRPLRFFGIHF
jgi:hypothetical protein